MALAQAPYDKYGNLLSQENFRFRQNEGTWQPNIPFKAHMTVVNYSTNGHSAKVIIANDEGRNFPMFITDAIKFLKVANLTNGRTTEPLTWHVVKRGSAYGLTMIP